MVNTLLCLLLGMVAGILSGLIGIGGGIIIVPALVLLFGLSQHNAQGTTLALMVPPIGLLAACFLAACWAPSLPREFLTRFLQGFSAWRCS